MLEPIEPKGMRRLEPIEPKGRRQKLALHAEHTRNTQTHATHKHVRMELGAVMGQGICLESDADMSLRNDVSLKK